MRIAVDAMGGDYAPHEAVLGAVEAAKEWNVPVVLVGREEELKKELASLEYPSDLISIVNAEKTIGMNEHPATAVRKKRNSSIVVANRLVKDGEADAIISAGNTGAAMAASLLTLGRIPGVSRPAIAIPMPTVKGVTVLLDAGANADCDPEDLLQFAIMGSIYAEAVLKITGPKVGLLNIGEEEEKGNRLTLATYSRLKESSLHFIGNVEGRDIPFGVCDVLVCDGFVGNTILKFTEGFAAALFSLMKEALLSTTRTKFGAFLIKPGLKSLKARMDYSEYGGAPLLGVRGVSIISHGSSNAKAFKNAIRSGVNAINEDVTGKIHKLITTDQKKS
ncbi:MAG TPA: phosphate acyltransferase PlsX [Bacillota bacterium]